MLATCNGHTEAARILVEKEHGIQTEEGWSALMYAAESNQVDIAQLLLNTEKSLAELQWVDGSYASCRKGIQKLIRLLLQLEAKIHDKHGLTALMYSAWSGHSEIVALLLPYEGNELCRWLDCSYVCSL